MAKAKKPAKLTRKQKTALKQVLDQILSDPAALATVTADPRAALIAAGLESADIDNIMTYISEMRGSLGDVSISAARGSWWTN